LSGRAFEGLRIADFSWGVTGPLTTKYLGDHGATVVRVESEERPCIARLVGPYAGGKPGIDRAGYFAFINANKYSCAINLKNERGLEVAKRLISWADVVVESFRPGTMDELGLDYDMIKKIKSDIIYLHTSTLGATGPDHRYGGYGIVLVALCGFSHLTGYPDDEPLPFPHAYTDFICPRFLASALIASLIYRLKTGEGQFIDGSQMESCLWFLSPSILDYTANKRQAERKGNSDDRASPHGVFRGKGNDRWVAISVSNNDEWTQLCQAMGKPVWTQNKKYSTSVGRKEDEYFIHSKITEWTMKYTPEEIMKRLQFVGVPAGTVHNGKDLAENPELRNSGVLWTLEHDQIGKFTHLGQPFQMSRTPAAGSMASPSLGMHTAYVCSQILGLNDNELVDLFKSGALK